MVAWVHKWSSIVCTVFMLLLCITGLPLIFHEEIDDVLHEQVKPAAVAERNAEGRSRPRRRQRAGEISRASARIS